MNTRSQWHSFKSVNFWFPGEFNRGPALVVWLGCLSVHITILIKLITSSSTNRYPEALAALLFLGLLTRHWQTLRHDRGIQLLGLSLALQLLFFGINYLIDPVTAMAYKNLEKLTRLMLFIPVAWWLGGSQRSIMQFLVVGFLGLLLAVSMDPHLENSLARLASGRRVDFGILNAQHVALYFSIALIGFLSFGHRALSIRNTRLKWIASTLVLIGVVTSLLVIVGTQTRAAWLALVCMAALCVVLNGKQWLASGKQNKPAFIGVSAVVLLSLIVLSQFQTNIQDRITREHETWSVLATGDWGNIPYSSIGIRINTWIEAGKWIREKPLIGWGGDVRQAVIAQSETLPERVQERFGHFHNIYIEFTLSYGLMGLAFLLYLFYWPLRTSLRLYRTGACPKDIATFTFYSVGLLAIMGFFESYLFFWSGAFITLFALSPAYSMILKKQMQASS